MKYFYGLKENYSTIKIKKDFPFELSYFSISTSSK